MMNFYKTVFKSSALILLLGLSVKTLAQGVRFDQPLTMQGLDKNAVQSAASRAMGQTTIGMTGDASLMFTNPAALQSLNCLQISVGNTYHLLNESQTQQYGPSKYYGNFSLLMEGLTNLIPDPVYDSAGTYTGRDTVQRPYDNIGPNWSRKKNKNLPYSAIAAMPFTVGNYKVVAGLGAVQYADLNYYYQNNNVLSPAINIQRPYPVKLVTNDSSYVPVQWYQNIRDRAGEVYGYGAAVSVGVNENLSVGLSGMLIKGSTDDFESQVGRGRMIFYSTYFRLDSVDYRKTKTGTSDYSGAEFNISASYKTKNITIGFSVKPPSSITRDYNYTYVNDSMKVSKSSVVSGSDKIKLPWRGSIGLSVSVLSNLRAAIEYELRPMAKADYESGGNTTSPWKSSQLFHMGVEYSPLEWLTVRGGYRDQAEVYEPEGNPFEGDPVSSTVISAGLGLKYQSFILNLTYEYVNVKFDDMLQDCVILNSAKNNYISAEISYNIDLPWFK